MDNELGTTEREIIEQRLQKASLLRTEGVNPYPSRSNRNCLISEATSNKESLIGSQKAVIVAGRMMAKRGHGKLIFADLEDETGKIQLVFRQDILGEKNFALASVYDVGDFIEAFGPLFVTKAGELSIEVHETNILAKSIRPLPEQWFGLKDEESRLRKRYLDLILNKEVRELFYKRAKFWQSTRNFLVERGFIEVETPVLENTAGGADADPFVTHHNALDMDVYLRISMGELWQKRLMVAGFTKTFEIGRQFRNEGMSREHLQDYTQMEFYWGYANYNDSMRLVQDLYQHIAKETFGTLKFKIGKFDIDLSGDWPKIDYVSTIHERLDIDVLSASDAEIKEKITSLGVKFSPVDKRGRLIDILWKQIRRTIAGPVFLINHPVEVSPLAKRKEDDPRLVERYQPIIAGSELGNGYSELNDPVDQAERFGEQAKMRDEGDTEAQMFDHDFIEALEYGMPPTTGFGFSERLFSFLANKSAREAQLFPLLRPESKNKIGRAKETKLATVILNKSSKLNHWQQLNAVAHLNASFAARSSDNLILQDKIRTKDGAEINLNIQAAILVREASDNPVLIDLIEVARSRGLEVYEFIREMVESSDDKKIAGSTVQKNLDQVEFLGILIYGKKSLVAELTENFPLVKE